MGYFEVWEVVGFGNMSANKNRLVFSSGAFTINTIVVISALFAHTWNHTLPDRWHTFMFLMNLLGMGMFGWRIRDIKEI